MLGTKRGMIPARRLLPVLFLIAASAPLAAGADDGIVDVRTLPRLEGAMEDTSRTQLSSLNYGVPTVVSVTAVAAKMLLVRDGWVQFLRPLDEKSTSLTFKKAQQGLSVHFTQGLGRPDQSVVYYSADRITANVPFPPDAADIIFDQHRPYLGCIAPAAFDATVNFFRKEMQAIGWKPLSAADAAARWSNAKFSETIENGARTYYTHEDGDSFYRQQPVMVTLQRREDGKTSVDIRIAPFALPQTLEADSDTAGLPKPRSTKSAQGSGDSNSVRRKLDVAVIAEIPATLAFYRRELAARNWTEETSGAVVTADNVSLNFTSAEQTASLKLSRKYDFTIVALVTQLKDSALAARAKAKKEADTSSSAMRQRRQSRSSPPMKRGELPRLPICRTRPCALADSSKPVPLPENAENVKFDGADGKLEFDSSSSVKAIARSIVPRSRHRAGRRALGHQQIQHGRDGVFQGWQGNFVHGHADGPQGQRQRRWIGSCNGKCQNGGQARRGN